MRPNLKRFFATLILILLLGSVQTHSVVSTDSYVRSDKLGITFISGGNIPNSPERYERALSLGAGWNRYPLYWNDVETEPGVFEWSVYDDVIANDLEYGLNTILALLGVPEFYADGNLISGVFEPVFADGSDFPEPGKAINPNNPWANYVHQSVMRYMPNGARDLEQGWNDGIRVWEVWNEPDFEQFWTGGVIQYARLLKTAYLVIHSVDPDALVMHGGMLYPQDGRNWLAEVLAVFEEEPFHEENNWYMDAVAIHNYGDAWRSGWLTLYVRQTLIAYGMDRPIWLTETGVPVWDDYPGPAWARDPLQHSTRATATQQAAFFIQSSAYAWAEGADTIFYHQLYDDCGNQPPSTDFPPHDGAVCQADDVCYGDAFGLFRNPVGSHCFSQHPEPDTPRPVAEAYELVTRVFGSVPFSERAVIDDNRFDGAIWITFTRPAKRERIVVLWNTRQEPVEVSVPALGIAASVITFAQQKGALSEDGAYRITLPAAEIPRQRWVEPRLQIDIGGEPVILIEQVTDQAAWDELLLQTVITQPQSAASNPTPGG
jgi:hypothetical protein